MITMKDSWIQKIVERYFELANQLKTFPKFDFEKDARNFHKLFFNDEFIIKEFVKKLYFYMVLKLGTDGHKIDEKRYFLYCTKHVNHIKNEVLRIHEKTRFSKLNPADKFINIITELKVFAGKSYKQDVRFVIHSVESAVKGYSLDSDVIWLYEFNYHLKDTNQ